jgi:hypothetical protein
VLSKLSCKKLFTEQTSREKLHEAPGEEKISIYLPFDFFLPLVRTFSASREVEK